MTASLKPAPAGSRAALTALAVALVLGILGDILVNGTPGPGINVFIGIAALILGARLVRRHAPETAPGQGRWLLTALGFASCFAIRDAESLLVLNFLAVSLALGLAAIGWLAPDHRVARLRDCVLTLARAAGHAAAGPFLLLGNDTVWAALRGKSSARLVPIAAGLVLALPIILIFGAIFAEADPVFAEFAATLFGWNAERIVEHIFITGVLTWLSAGALKAWLWTPREITRTIGNKSVVTISATPIGIALGAMNLMFLLFVSIQARYLFGGMDTVRDISGLTLAEYARGGFFQMLFAAGLVVPALFVSDVVLDRSNTRAVQNVRALGSLQLILTLAVMASALSRMALYMQSYGLTEDRIVAMAILVWLAVVLVWLANTVLRGRRERFMWGALISGFVVLGGLNAANPHALIVRHNVARLGATPVPGDEQFLLTLSADAAPAVAEWLGTMTPAQRCARAVILWEHTRQTTWSTDWRSLNLSRWQARRIMRTLLPGGPSGPC